MNTQYILPTIVLFATVTTQAMATGLSYDPYENYYRDYYGIDADKITKEAIARIEVVSPDLTAQLNNGKTIDEDFSEFADPSNFFNW